MNVLNMGKEVCMLFYQKKEEVCMLGINCW